mmetsp:Transcript_45060/g.94335  ORF Transcript_45060/g.94335 Transcript_45060/m.94335 type:complete len:213 (+) Transcript_45060:260-898(+)
MCAGGSDPEGHSWGRASAPGPGGQACGAAARSSGRVGAGWIGVGAARVGPTKCRRAGDAAGCRAFGRTTAVKAVAGRSREVKADGPTAPATMCAARAGSEPPRSPGPELAMEAAQSCAAPDAQGRATGGQSESWAPFKLSQSPSPGRRSAAIRNALVPTGLGSESGPCVRPDPPISLGSSRGRLGLGRAFPARLCKARSAPRARGTRPGGSR